MNKSKDDNQDILEKIIISKITGGLGNQLFQYAFAKKLALETGATLLLDIQRYTTTFSIFTRRNLELFYFPIHAEILTNEHLKRLPDELFLLEETCHLIYEEISIHDTDFPLYIRGYWQSWKYLNPTAQILRSELHFQTEKFSTQVRSFGRMLSETFSVGIHIRRTDYAKNPQLGILPVNYYCRAAHFFKQMSIDFTFYVFSDDPDWVEANLNIQSPFQVVRGYSSFEDFYLMSQCQNNIIANSSFSWWAAWLNPNPDKIVVVPQFWHLGEGLDISKTDLIPPEWISLW